MSGARPTASPDRLDRPAGDPLADRLFPRLALATHWELGRTSRALQSLGDPQGRFASLHVGGTNGKGSASATMEAVLRTAGRRVGLYTSPQLCSFRERFLIDGRPVAESPLLAASERVRGSVEQQGLTFFEAATVLAFDLFAEAGVEVAVVEVGLGGRLDATNVLRPAVSAVTNVALDHEEYLGGDLVAIAGEKAGIVKPGVPVVVGERDPVLVEVFRRVAADRGAPFHAVDPARDIRDVEVTRGRTSFTLRTDRWGELRLRTRMVGAHQAANVAVAVTALERLPAFLAPEVGAVLEGVASVEWPGRGQLETIDGREWLFDVAHNPAGVGTLVDTLDRLEPPVPWVALVGVARDKDWPSMLQPILARCQSVWLTRPELGPPERRWDPEEVARSLETEPGLRRRLVQVEPDFAAALRGARREAGAGTMVVTGSAYTVGSALLALGRPPFGIAPPAR